MRPEPAWLLWPIPPQTKIILPGRTSGLVGYCGSLCRHHCRLHHDRSGRPLCRRMELRRIRSRTDLLGLWNSNRQPGAGNHLCNNYRCVLWIRDCPGQYLLRQNMPQRSEFENAYTIPYRLLGCAFAVIGSVGALSMLWNLFDFFFGVCTVCRLFLCIAMHKQVLAIFKAHKIRNMGSQQRGICQENSGTVLSYLDSVQVLPSYMQVLLFYMN